MNIFYMVVIVAHSVYRVYREITLLVTILPTTQQPAWHLQVLWNPGSRGEGPGQYQLELSMAPDQKRLCLQHWDLTMKVWCLVSAAATAWIVYWWGRGVIWDRQDRSCHYHHKGVIICTLSTCAYRKCIEILLIEYSAQKDLVRRLLRPPCFKNGS